MFKDENVTMFVNFYQFVTKSSWVYLQEISKTCENKIFQLRYFLSNNMKLAKVKNINLSHCDDFQTLVKIRDFPTSGLSDCFDMFFL